MTTLAYAADSVSQSSSIWQSLQSMSPLLVIIVIFYFLVIRPQQKRLKEHKMMLSNLKKGDRIVTAGGIVAIVHKVESDDETLFVDIAKDVNVKIMKNTISQVLEAEEKTQPIVSSKSTKPAKSKAKDKK